jgi:hypothetical protein
LAQVAGIQGPEMDRMRADLIANFAKATGQQNNPFIQQAIKQLRQDPAARAAQDPELQARMKMLRDLQNEQAEATRKLNEINAAQQANAIKVGSQPLITALSSAGTAISNSVNRLAGATGTTPITQNRGGLIYASKGKLINFQPKGTDTVPAMLTPGEFVVNKKATQKNLGLLRSINNGQSTGGNYAVGGVVNSGTPTLDQNTINRAVAGTINNFQGTLNNVNKNTTDTKKKIDNINNIPIENRIPKTNPTVKFITLYNVFIVLKIYCRLTCQDLQQTYVLSFLVNHTNVHEMLLQLTH